MNADEHRDALRQKIIGCATDASNCLGCGFPEKVYENAMSVALRRAGLSVEQPRKVDVCDGNEIVGQSVADLVVEGCVPVEVKAAKALDEAYSAQCINHLRASGVRVCLLINFARPGIEIRRFVHGQVWMIRVQLCSSVVSTVR